MGDNHYKKALSVRRNWAIILSVAFAAGVVMIPVGFSFGVLPVGIIGIVFAVAGFYGCPLMWVSYSGLAAYSGVFGLIAEDGMRSATAIAGALGISIEQSRKAIVYLIRKRFLRGYAFDGTDTITATGIDKLEAERLARRAAALGKCPNCGATLVESDGRMVCPYCGSKFGGQ